MQTHIAKFLESDYPSLSPLSSISFSSSLTLLLKYFNKIAAVNVAVPAPEIIYPPKPGKYCLFYQE